VEYANVLLERKDRFGIIRINRPDVRNALNELTLKEIEHALKTLELDERVLVIAITGVGEKAFVSGADIRALQEKRGIDALLPSIADTFALVENCPKATVAIINGFALGGGCELAMACDIRIAAEHAKLGLPELNLGIIPGAGGTQRLARLIGKGRAIDMILTGEIISAKRAEEIGLVSQVVPYEELWEAAETKMSQIASKGPWAVRLAKLAVNRGFDIDQPTAMLLERMAQGVLFGTTDKQEGTQAFLDKRLPDFRGL